MGRPCSGSLMHKGDFALCMQSTDPDVRATAARIKQFVMDHTYRQPPEGSELPEYDQSTDVGLA